MHELILFIVAVFAIVIIWLAVKFVFLLRGDAAAYIRFFNEMSAKQRDQKLKQFVVFLCAFVGVGSAIIIAFVCYVVYQSMLFVWQNNLPNYVPDTPVYFELDTFSDDAYELMKLERRPQLKLLSQNLIALQFSYENEKGSYNKYFEIVDSNKGKSIAGFLVERENLRTSDESAPYKHNDAKVVLLDGAPVFIYHRHEKHNPEYDPNRKTNSWRQDEDYWLIQSNDPPLELDRDQMRLARFEEISDHFIQPTEEGMKQYTLTNNGFVESASWNLPANQLPNGIFTWASSFPTALAEGFYVYSQLGDRLMFFDSRGEWPVVRSFDVDYITSILPKEYRTTHEEVMGREHTLSMKLPIQIDSHSVDLNGNVLIVLNYYRRPIIEINANKLKEGNVEDIFTFLGKYDEEFTASRFFDDNKKIIFHTQGDHALSWHDRDAYRRSTIDRYYLNERCEDGTLGAMDNLDFSALHQFDDSWPVIHFPKQFDGRVFVFADQAIWSICLDGTGLTKVFPKQNLKK